MSSDNINLDFKHLFSRSLKQMSPCFGYSSHEPLNKTNDKLPDDSYHVGYTHNTYGYRCNEFSNQKIMFLGCSNTYGMGLKVEDTWPNILSQMLGVDYINLAKGGDSAPAQVSKAFQFFKEFYNPEVIVAMFPIFRIESPKVKKFLERDSENNKGGYEILQHFFNNDHADILKFAKAPYNLDDILPKEFSIFYSFLFIQILAQYCYSNNIKLVWTTNDISSYEEIKQLLNLKNPEGFINVDYFNLTSLDDHKCHLEFSKNVGFSIAADNGHVGSHYHMHLAEQIYGMNILK